MVSSHAALSIFYKVLYKLGIFRWILVAICLATAMFKWRGLAVPQISEAILWGLMGLLLVGVSIVAELFKFTVFRPTALDEEETGDIPPLTYGIASGNFMIWDRFKWLPPEDLYQQNVQVRWLAGERPPVLAVLGPIDLPTDVPEPLKEADEVSLWHPGVEVTTGHIWVGRKVYAGLRLRFVGRTLYLALANPRLAIACAKALHSEPQEEKSRSSEKKSEVLR